MPSVASVANEPALEFSRQIAPLLEQRCLRCHRGLTARGHLSLTTRDDLLRGGDSGPALVPGDPAASLLLEMTSGDQPAMPAEGQPLSAAEHELLTRWVAAGAVWPTDHELTLPLDAAPWWSLDPLVAPTVPPWAHDEKWAAWVRTPIDAFVAQSLATQGLQPAPEADRRTLIRRLTFDLVGLPPTPEEVTAFLSDNQPGAYERLVDRLLTSPAHGQRWARHWLDVVHFGETHGYDKDKRRDHAWPYRDWVIDALNRDLPYGQFVTAQLAGDVLSPDDPQSAIPTGMIAAGPWDFVGQVELAEGTLEKDKTRVLDRDDMVATVMATFTSTTVHCARCHDHPFDPVPQADYYALQAVFAGVDRGDRSRESRSAAAQRAQLSARLAELGNPPTEGSEPPERTATRAQLATEQAALGAEPLVYAVRPIAPRPIRVLARGNVETPREPEMQPGALSVIREVSYAPEAGNVQEGARRVALARWLVDRRHPLTWRSIVNRVWHYHFGRGLVDTPNDFGRQGSRPSHPELLDWLATSLVDQGESLRWLHREMVTSSVYRQAAVNPTVPPEADADNRFLSRFQRRRLEGEAIRDAVLAASGKLDARLGGPSFALFEFEDDHSPRYKYVPLDGPEVWRRTIYRLTVRSVQNPFLETLDCPDPSQAAPVRNTTITALQALALWNDAFVLKQASYLAQRIEEEFADEAARVNRLFELALGRPPDDAEMSATLEVARTHGLAAVCRVVLNTNEFQFVD